MDQCGDEAVHALRSVWSEGGAAVEQELESSCSPCAEPLTCDSSAVFEWSSSSPCSSLCLRCCESPCPLDDGSLSPPPDKQLRDASCSRMCAGPISGSVSAPGCSGGAASCACAVMLGDRAAAALAHVPDQAPDDEARNLLRWELKAQHDLFRPHKPPAAPHPHPCARSHCAGCFSSGSGSCCAAFLAAPAAQQHHQFHHLQPPTASCTAAVKTGGAPWPGGEAASRNRSLLVDWMSQLCSAAGMQRETLFTATSLMDRFVLTSEAQPPESMLQLLAMAAMSVAMKFEEVVPVRGDHLLRLAVDPTTGQPLYKPDDLFRMEWLLLRAVDWRLRAPHVLTFVHRFLHAALASCCASSPCCPPARSAGCASGPGCDGGYDGAAATMCTRAWGGGVARWAFELAELSLLHDSLLHFNPSTVALACVLLAQRAASAALATAAGAAAAACATTTPSPFSTAAATLSPSPLLPGAAALGACACACCGARVVAGCGALVSSAGSGSGSGGSGLNGDAWVAGVVCGVAGVALAQLAPGLGPCLVMMEQLWAEREQAAQLQAQAQAAAVQAQAAAQAHAAAQAQAYAAAAAAAAAVAAVHWTPPQQHLQQPQQQPAALFQGCAAAAGAATCWA